MGGGKRRIREIVVIVVEERVEELGRVVLGGVAEGGEGVVCGVVLACGGVCLGDKAQEVLIHGAVERETARYYVIARFASVKKTRFNIKDPVRQNVDKRGIEPSFLRLRGLSFRLERDLYSPGSLGEQCNRFPMEAKILAAFLAVVICYCAPFTWRAIVNNRKVCTHRCIDVLLHLIHS